MRYRVNVKFNSDILEISENEIKVGILAKPENGKANVEVIKKLAKHFKVPLNMVRIVQGRASKHKIIEI